MSINQIANGVGIMATGVILGGIVIFSSLVINFFTNGHGSTKFSKRDTLTVSSGFMLISGGIVGGLTCNASFLVPGICILVGCLVVPE